MKLNKGTEVSKGSKARQSLVEGFEYLNDAVKTSLGPNGRNTVFRKAGIYTNSTKDGISIMKSINAFEEPIQYGVDLLREASFKTVTEAGDGTTSTSIIATAITKAGVEALNEKDSNLSPVGIKAGIEKATKAIVGEIRNKSIPVDLPALINVATIASNNDMVTGEMVAKAVFEVTSRGDVLIERSPNFKTYSKIEAGTKYPKGYADHSLINNTAARTSEMQNVYILVSKDDVVRAEHYANIIESLVKKDPTAALLVVAPTVAGSAMSFLTSNNNAEQSPMRGRFCAIEAVGSSKFQTEVLDDLALMTGATMVGESIGVKPEQQDYTVLGRAGKVLVTKDSTLIVDPKTISEEDLLARKEYLTEQVTSTQGEDKESFVQRLAYLNGKAAVIYVGGNSDVEVNEKKDRIDDAVASSKAALEDGIVPGGGVTYMEAAKVDVPVDTVSEAVGVNIVKEALIRPFSQILENADFNNYTPEKGDVGFNIKTGEYGNLIEMGVVDASRVLISSIQNAASVSATVLLTEVLVYERTETHV